MSFIGANPKRNQRLDALRKSQVNLLGIPAPIPPLVGGDSCKGAAGAEIVREMFDRRLREMGPRADRAAIFREVEERVRSLWSRTLGTDQPPIMLTFGEPVYCAFIQDSMTPDDLQAFITGWKIRGCVPATILAHKEVRVWTYELVTTHRMI